MEVQYYTVRIEVWRKGTHTDVVDQLTGEWADYFFTTEEGLADTLSFISNNVSYVLDCGITKYGNPFVLWAVRVKSDVLVENDRAFKWILATKESQDNEQQDVVR